MPLSKIKSKMEVNQLRLDSSAASTDENERVLLDASAAATDAGYAIILEDSTEGRPSGTSWLNDLNASGLPLAAARQSSQNIQCQYENLVTDWKTVAHVRVVADAVLLTDNGGVQKRYPGLSRFLFVEASGANGLDTGSEASDTWYHMWAIGKQDGTLDGLLSLAYPGSGRITFPAGYTFSGYLGAIYNNSAGNFNVMYQRGRWVSATAQSAVSAGTATSRTDMSSAVAVVVPQTALQATGYWYGSTSSGTAAIGCNISNSSGADTGFIRLLLDETNTGAMGSYFRALMITSQSLWYYVSGANARVTIDISGWEY